MSLKEFQTTMPISLDIYNTNIKTINAKQLDSKSRYVKVSCTKHGQKIELDKDSVFAYVRYLKPDGKAVLNACTVGSDSTITFELTQQMLLVPGKAVADIMLFEVKTTEDNNNVSLPKDELFFHGVDVDDNDEGDVTVTFNHENSFIHTIKTIEELDTINLPLLSTMTLYVNVLPTTVNHAEIESSHEYNALIEGLEEMKALGILLNDQEAVRNSAESNRISAEENRIGAEQNRISAEANRISAETNRVSAETNRVNAEANRASAESGRVDNENARVSAEQARALADDERAENVETAITKCNSARELCESVINQSGIVLKSEKGVAGGVAELDNTAHVPAGQLNIANDLLTVVEGKILDARQGKVLKDEISDLASAIEELRTAIAGIHKVYHGIDDPDSSIGKDGDIYMKIIEDANETAGE